MGIIKITRHALIAFCFSTIAAIPIAAQEVAEDAEVQAQIGLFLGGLFEAFFGARRGQHLEALGLQELFESPADGRFVVDDEDLLLGMGGIGSHVD